MSFVLAAAAISAIGAYAAAGNAEAPSGHTTIVPSVRVEAPVFGTRIDTGETIPLQAQDVIREIADGNIGLANSNQYSPQMDYIPIFIGVGILAALYMVVK